MFDSRNILSFRSSVKVERIAAIRSAHFQVAEKGGQPVTILLTLAGEFRICSRRALLAAAAVARTADTAPRLWSVERRLVGDQSIGCIRRALCLTDLRALVPCLTYVGRCKTPKSHGAPLSYAGLLLLRAQNFFQLLFVFRLAPGLRLICNHARGLWLAHPLARVRLHRFGG